MKNTYVLATIFTTAILVSGCDSKSSSSSSSGGYSGPSGFTSEQKDRYNNLSPEGKAHVDQQMRTYDRMKREGKL